MQKTALFYFRNSFIKPLSIPTLLYMHTNTYKWHTNTSMNLLSPRYFSVHTTVKLLHCKVLDFTPAPYLWHLIPNIQNFNSVYYRILAVLQEWVYEQHVRVVESTSKWLWQLVKHSANDHWSHDWSR